MFKRAKAIEAVSGPPLVVPHDVLKKVDETILLSLTKPHLFHPQLMPLRRLLLVFGQPGDATKGDTLEAVLRAHRAIEHVAQVDMAHILRHPDTWADTLPKTASQPAVIILNSLELGAREPFACNLEAKLLSLLPVHYGVICVANEPPRSGQPLWDQFDCDARVAYDLPSAQDICSRLCYNFETFAAHCAVQAELRESIAVRITPADCAALAKFAAHHLMHDVDQFCRRVYYDALQRAAAGGAQPAAVIDMAFAESHLVPHGQKERTLSRRDCMRAQWEFDQAMGKVTGMG